MTTWISNIGYRYILEHGQQSLFILIMWEYGTCVPKTSTHGTGVRKCILVWSIQRIATRPSFRCLIMLFSVVHYQAYRSRIHIYLYSFLNCVLLIWCYEHITKIRLFFWCYPLLIVIAGSSHIDLHFLNHRRLPIWTKWCCCGCSFPGPESSSCDLVGNRYRKKVQESILDLVDVLRSSRRLSNLRSVVYGLTVQKRLSGVI